MIWKHSIPDILQGYAEESESYTCTMCEKSFAKGSIYQSEDTLFDAYGAVKNHVKAEHGLTVDFLLQQNLNLTGISEVQRQILQMISDGLTDKEIAASLGNAYSTIRNHRLKLREKKKQAKLFLALMESLERKVNSQIEVSDAGIIDEIHKSATMIDDRYNITETERQKAIQTYMDETGALKQFPAKEKKKLILLCEIIKNFKKDVSYSENEVNRILKRIYEPDFAAIRRYLIQYGFMERSDDCLVYRVLA